MRYLDNSWKEWIKRNIDRGCNKKELEGILLKKKKKKKKKNDFIYEDIKKELYENTEIYSKSIITIPNSIKFDSDKVELYTLDNFLTDEECDKIIKIAQTNLTDSKITNPNKGWHKSIYRTSKTSRLDTLSDINKKYMNSIDDKICNIMNINNKLSEGIQSQYYSVGKEFKQHFDFFKPGSKEYGRTLELQKHGNRTWTFMVYLNNVEEGGATYMVKLDTRFYPKKGRALIWNNLLDNGEPNANTLHAGEPPLKGEKYIITKWFREKSK